MKNTKKRIIDAAILEFAENGYKKATVRGICERAHVNVASINYHFLSKQDLYFQIFEQYLPQGEIMKLPDGEKIKSQEDLIATLDLWISSMLSRVLNARKENMKLFMQIAMHELIFPSEVRTVLSSKYLNPDRDSIRSILDKTTLPDEEKTVKIISLLGKCTFYIYHKYAVEKISGSDNFLKNNFKSVVASILRETMVDLQYVDK